MGESSIGQCSIADLSIAEILYNQICAIGMIISYHGWNGKDDSNAGGKLLSALVALRYAGVSKELIIRLKQRV